MGGHVFLQSLLPSRGEYRNIAVWLADQVRKNGADVRTSSPVTVENLDCGPLSGKERFLRKKLWHISSACHAGLLGDNRTPVGSVIL